MKLSTTFAGIRERVAGDKRYFCALTVLTSALSLPLFSWEQRQIVLPVLAIANIAVFFMTSLLAKGHKEPLPLFEIGTVYCAVLTVYSLVPFLNYLSAGMSWTDLSDNRLLTFSASSGDVGRFAWNYVVYFASFAVAYLCLRAKAGSQKRVVVISDSPSLLVIALPLAVLIIYFFILRTVWGVDTNPSYSRLADSLNNLKRLPLIIVQVSGHLRGILLLLKMALLFLLFEKWKSKWWRSVLGLWLAVETIYTILNMGARFETALLLMCALLFYHRLVKPFRISQAVILGILFIAGFQMVGIARNRILGSGQPQPPVTFQSLVSVTSEFQSMFATAYDLEQMKKTGRLGEIPGQLYLSDFVMPVPQQLLPFKKIDPSLWYVEVKGIKNQTGFMFGVIAQSVIGFGRLELALRGAVVGVIFAWSGRWYRRRSSRFLPTLFYVWLCVWSYYTFRASTFYLLSPIIYRVLPAMALIYFGERWRRWAHPTGPAL
jgi:hypothetical protein